MESTDPQILVQKNLQVLGIESAASRVYIELLKLGPSSALQIAKATHISRPQIYRHLEQLQTHNLVSGEQLSYGTFFCALPLQNIERLIADRESQTAAVKHNIGAMVDSLETLVGSSGPKSSTVHYYGRGGLKQVNWNLTKASKEYRVFETGQVSQHIDRAFARRCREQFVDRKLARYNLTNATSVDTKDIEPFEPSHTHYRHIDPEILKINFETYLYDEVITLIYYGPVEPQATEIHHPALAMMMRQLFDTMWNIAEPLAT